MVKPQMQTTLKCLRNVIWEDKEKKETYEHLSDNVLTVQYEHGDARLLCGGRFIWVSKILKIENENSEKIAIIAGNGTFHLIVDEYQWTSFKNKILDIPLKKERKKKNPVSAAFTPINTLLEKNKAAPLLPKSPHRPKTVAFHSPNTAKSKSLLPNQIRSPLSSRSPTITDRKRILSPKVGGDSSPFRKNALRVHRIPMRLDDIIPPNKKEYERRRPLMDLPTFTEKTTQSTPQNTSQNTPQNTSQNNSINEKTRESAIPSNEREKTIVSPLKSINESHLTTLFSTPEKSPTTTNSMKDKENEDPNQWWSKTQKKSTTIKGLINLGNTCYLNAVLQVFISLTAFVQDLLKEEWKSILHVLNEKKKLSLDSLPVAPLSDSNEKEQDSPTIQPKDLEKESDFYHCFLKVLSSVTEATEVVNPAPLKQAIAKRSSRFDSNAQQDAHEFLLDTINQLDADLERYGSGYDKKSWSKVVLPTTKYFHAEIDRVLTCTECKYTRSRTEMFRDFSLDLEVQETSTTSTTLTTSSLTTSLTTTSTTLTTSSLTTTSTTLTTSSTTSSLTTSSLTTSSSPLGHLPSPASSPTSQCSCGKYQNKSPRLIQKKLPLVNSPTTTHQNQNVDDNKEDEEDDHQKKTTSCKKCHNMENAEPSLHPLPTLLYQHFRPHSVDLVCEKCQQDGKTTISYKVKQLPGVLILHIKRFQVHSNGVLSKRTDRIPIPKRLTEKDFQLESIQENKQQFIYELQSVIHHMGTNAYEGHYLADVRSIPKDSWTRFNDSLVKEISDLKALGDEAQKSAYILFYVLQ